MKKLLKLIALAFLSSSLYANTVTKEECEKNDEEEFIFAGGECINYFAEEGDNEEALTIIVHGSWPVGANTLARYSTFASNVSMNTDITTVAFALPGYSKSSQNNLEALTKKDAKAKRAGSKKYVEFLGKLIHTFKNKYNAKTINVISHSAGAMMTSTLSLYEPGLMKNIVLAGGNYKVKNVKNMAEDFIHIEDHLSKLSSDTNYLLVYGTKDKISVPKRTIDFHKVLQSKGANTKLVEVKGQAHLDLDMSDTSVDALTVMFEE